MSELNKPKEAVNVRQNAQKEAILAQLRQIPIIQLACQKAGISRAQYYRLRDLDEKFKAAVGEAIAEGVAFISDMSESQLISLIREKNWQAIAFWLRARHPAYRTKVDVSAQIAPAPAELTPEQETEIERALKLASLLPAEEPEKQLNQKDNE